LIFNRLSHEAEDGKIIRDISDGVLKVLYRKMEDACGDLPLKESSQTLG